MVENEVNVHMGQEQTALVEILQENGALRQGPVCVDKTGPITCE